MRGTAKVRFSNWWKLAIKRQAANCKHRGTLGLHRGDSLALLPEIDSVLTIGLIALEELFGIVIMSFLGDSTLGRQGEEDAPTRNVELTSGCDKEGAIDRGEGDAPRPRDGNSGYHACVEQVIKGRCRRIVMKSYKRLLHGVPRYLWTGPGSVNIESKLCCKLWKEQRQQVGYT